MGVYTEFFQKSKVFLYPLLKIRKGVSHVPVQTYVAWENVYSTENNRFFCEYSTKMTSTFKKDYIELNNDKHLFIFDFTAYKSDFQRFISGAYSQFSLNNKISILDFFSNQKKISSYVEGFLSPEDVHELYAKELGVDVEIIQKIYEVCSPPDLKKETFIDNTHIIFQLLKKSSISLTKQNK
jgi:hypothetical protein